MTDDKLITLNFTRLGKKANVRCDVPGLIKNAADGDPAATELVIDYNACELAVDAVVAYIQMWSKLDDEDVKETEGPKIEPLTFSRCNDFMNPEEVAWVNSIKEVCETKIIEIKIFVEIAQLANYLGIPALVKKSCALSALAMMACDNLEITKEDMQKIKLPTSFKWKLGDRFVAPDILVSNPEMATEINAHREMPELESAIAEVQSSETSSVSDSDETSTS
jgi:hypothetical protein